MKYPFYFFRYRCFKIIINKSNKKIWKIYEIYYIMINIMNFIKILFLLVFLNKYKIWLINSNSNKRYFIKDFIFEKINYENLLKY